MNNIKNKIRQHLGLVLAGIACVVVAGGILILALTGAGGTSHAASASSSMTTSTTTVPGAPGGAPSKKGTNDKHHPVHGVVTAISGDTWTVTSQGVALTVKVTPQTKFGTKPAPMAPTDFAIGNEVTVVGARTGTTLTATRVAQAPAAGRSAPTSTTVPSAPSTG